MKLDRLQNDRMVLGVLGYTRDSLVGHSFYHPQLPCVTFQRYYGVNLFVNKRLLDGCVSGKRVSKNLTLTKDWQFLRHRLEEQIVLMQKFRQCLFLFHDFFNFWDALIALEYRRTKVDTLSVRCLNDIRDKFIPFHWTIAIDVHFTKQRIDSIYKVIDLVWLMRHYLLD